MLIIIRKKIILLLFFFLFVDNRAVLRWFIAYVKTKINITRTENSQSVEIACSRGLKTRGKNARRSFFFKNRWWLGSVVSSSNTLESKSYRILRIWLAYVFFYIFLPGRRFGCFRQKKKESYFQARVRSIFEYGFRSFMNNVFLCTYSARGCHFVSFVIKNISLRVLCATHEIDQSYIIIIQ